MRPGCITKDGSAEHGDAIAMGCLEKMLVAANKAKRWAWALDLLWTEND